MPRIVTFILVRLLALAWILVLSNVFKVIGPYAISILIIISEAIFGYLWAKAESEITMCKPKREDPAFLAYLMIGTAVIEGFIAWYLIGPYAVWVMLWRAMTAYLPFSIVEIISYDRRCRLKKR